MYKKPNFCYIRYINKNYEKIKKSRRKVNDYLSAARLGVGGYAQMPKI